MTRAEQAERIRQKFAPRFVPSPCRCTTADLKIDALAIEVLDLMRQGLVPVVCKCGKRSTHVLKDCLMLGSRVRGF